MDEHEPTPVEPEEAARALKRELSPKPKREPKPEPRRARFKPGARRAPEPAAIPEPEAPVTAHQEIYNRNWWWAFVITFLFSFFGLFVYLISGLFGMAGKFEYERYAGRGRIRGSLVGMACSLVFTGFVWMGIMAYAGWEEAKLQAWAREQEAKREQRVAEANAMADVKRKEAETKRIEAAARRDEAQARARAAEAERETMLEKERIANRDAVTHPPTGDRADVLRERAEAESQTVSPMPDWQERERIRLEEQVKAREEKRIIDARLKAAAAKREAEAEVAKLQALRQEQKALLRRRDELAEELPKAQRAPRAYELQLNSAKDPDFRANLMRKQQEAHDRLRALEQEEGQLTPKLAMLERQILEARDRIVVLGGDVPPEAGAPGSAPKVAMVLELKDGSVVEAQRAILLNRVWHVKLMDGKEQQIVEEEIASTRKPQ